MATAPAFRSPADWSAAVDPRSVQPAPAPTGDILDLIDGALEDYTVSVDAARWVPDEADREMANVPARWVTADEVTDGTVSDSALPHGTEPAYSRWLGVLLAPPLAPDADGLVRVQLHTSSAGALDPEVGDPRSAVRTEPASLYASGGAVHGASPTYTWIDETRRWNVVPHHHTDDILAAAIAWYGHEALARHAAVLEARAQRAEATWSPAWLEAIRLAFNPGDLDFRPPRCPAHQDADEPTDPMERALWLRRNRNTGPKAKPRAPRRIDAKGSR